MKKIKILLLSIFLKMAAQGPLSPPTPYCWPQYGAGATPCNIPGLSNAPGNWINDFIHSFNTAGATQNIVNNNTGCNAQNFGALAPPTANNGTVNYMYWGCNHYMVASPGQVITSNFQSGNTYPQGCAVFIDWNQDGVFNAANFTGAVPGGERVTWTPGVPGAAVMTAMAPFTIPNVPAGKYRIRVRCVYATSGAVIQPCQMYTFGETEDYDLYIGMIPPGQMTPTVTVNSPTNNPMCTNSSTVISFSVALNTTLNVNTFTYTWTGPNGFNYTAVPASTANPNTPTASPTPTLPATSTVVSGIYTVVVNPGGCPVSQTVQVLVNQTPTINSVSNNGPLCQGNTASFTLNATSSATQQFQWSGPGGLSSTQQNPSFTNILPANSGAYNVTVTNVFANGHVCTATSNINLFVVPVAPLNVTPSFTQCQGTNIMLTANAVGASSYSWTGPSNYTSGIANPTLTMIHPTVHPGNYVVTAYFTNPQTTLVCTSTAVTNVSVVPMNPVTAYGLPFACQGSVYSFSANAAQANGYVWYGPNGYTSNVQADVINSVMPVHSGNYSVTAIFAIGTVSCYTHHSFSLDVVPINSIAVIPYIEICDKEGTIMTANAQGASSYTWNGPNNFSVNTQNAVYQNLNPSWSGIYTVTALFTNGYLNCYNTATTQLNVKPRLYFDLGADKRICFNDNILLQGPAGATGYTWTSSTSYTGNTQNAVIPNANPSNAGIYILTVDLNGCKTYDTVKVDILTPISWTLVPTNKSVCRGDKIEISVGVEGGSQNIAYNWNPPILSGPTGSYQIGNGVNTTVFQVTAYDIACPSYTISHSFSVEVKQPPIPQLELVKNYQCEPMCQVFNSKAGSQASIVMYDFGDNRIYTGDSIEICLPKGTYNLKIYTTGQNGCKGTFTLNGPIVVYPRPGADFHWTPEVPNTSENQVTFIPTVQHGTQISYYWQFVKDAQISVIDTSRLERPSRIYEDNGKFPVMLVATNEYGCVDTVYKVLEILEDMGVYIPNAFTPNGDGLNDVFNVKGIGLKQEKYLMQIFDRWGNLIYQTKDLNKGWDGTVKGVPAQEGVYIYQVRVIGTGNVGKKEFKGHVTLLR
jgi:gliding motility-associated-like protein